VRARPSQWAEIEDAIQKLDNVPLQVQIETRILEVNLTGQFQFGVQWYLEGLIGSTGSTSDGSFKPGQPYRHRQIGLGAGGNAFGGEPFFYSFLNSQMQVAVRAMEDNGNTKTLSAPSLVVMNNQMAHIQVGDEVPINQTSVSTIGTDNTYNQVQYLNTGVILNVQPRVNPGGLVYLNIQQQVSTPNYASGSNGNPTVSQREIGTQVAVQSGQTVLLGGLIQQDEGTDDTGIPGLNRIPILGRLFGSTARHRNRTELIVLITPRVIRNSSEAREITNDYQREFESLKPLRAARADAPQADVGPRVTVTPLAPSVAPAPMAATATVGSDTPEQLQQQAEAALRQTDYVMAQTLALRSWERGSRSGGLCVRNWQVIAAVRKHVGDAAGEAAARKWIVHCSAGTQ
jgi:general secretion pathway protein D